MGKSALVTNILHNIAMFSKVPVLLFSLEMPKSQIVLRMLSSETGIPYSMLRNGEIGNWEPVIQAMTRMKYMPFHVIDKRGLQVNAIKAEARKIKNEISSARMMIINKFS